MPSIEVQVSDADMQVGRVLEANWYQVSIVGVDVKPKKDKPSEINYVVDFEVIAGTDGNGDASGTECRRYFPSLGWMAALLKTKDIVLSKGLKLDLGALEGHQCDAYIKPGNEYQGRINNDVADFAKLGEKFGK